MRRPDGQTLFLLTVVAGSLILFAYLLVFNSNGQAESEGRGQRELTLANIPFNGQRSYEMLQRICALGPRYSGSPGMAQQQLLLKEHFEQLGGQVRFQEFQVPHPQTGEAVTLANLIVQWHPDRRERILLCAHYDTRPFPDRDPHRPRGVFIGANDGASGVAVLAELAYHMPQLNSRYGVDFVLFDAEEFVFNDRRDSYFLGSEHFARQYVDQPPPYTYRAGVLLDMVGDKELHLYQEVNSVRWPDTRPIVQDIWRIARRLGIREFVDRTRHEIRDDHLALRNIARIPTCDIIDFDYPDLRGNRYWHTEQDTPDKCSALSLAKVGWVLHEWLQRLQ